MTDKTVQELKDWIDVLCHTNRVEWEKATSEAKAREEEIEKVRVELDTLEAHEASEK